MKGPRQYNITPSRGQALLNFQGRRFPEKIDVYETEIIEEVRNTKDKEQSLFDKETELNSDFSNLLIQGDCLSACAYLKSQNIKVDLVYIDPPFASGANYAKTIFLRCNGREEIEGDDDTIGEEVMYGDIWQKEDYLNWLYERLLAIKNIMNENASIYAHLDWHIGHYVKILMDEVFGEENFKNEITWKRGTVKGAKARGNQYPRNHDTLYYYTINEEYIYSRVYKPFTEEYKKRFDKDDNNGKGPYRDDQAIGTRSKKSIKDMISEGKIIKQENGSLKIKTYLNELEGVVIDDVWLDISEVNVMATERMDYATQKPEELLKRIIEVSSNEGMIIADFFSGSGTTAKVAYDLNRKFVSCDIGINALQTTRDRLVKAGASFEVLKINDGLRLFRNPAQTTAKIFSLIDGFKTTSELGLNEFWNGGIAQDKGFYTPVKFSGIHDKLTKELLDVFLEEIYKLEDTTNKANEIIIIYAHKEIEIDQHYVNQQISRAAKTDLKVKLVSLDSLLGEKRDSLFAPDNADIKVSKQGDKYKVEIKKYFSPYLKKKIDDFNAKKTKKDTVEQDLSKAVKISKEGLELIESIQFDTTLKKTWKSNLELEDKAGIKEKIKGTYTLNTDKFKIKIRNIAGDEIIIDSKEFL